MRLLLLLAAGFLTLGFGCHSDPEFLKLSYHTVDKTRTFRNPRVPEELKTLLLGDKPPAKGADESAHEEKKEEPAHEEKPAEHGEASGEHGEKKDGPAPPPPPIGEFDHIPLKVYLYEKTEGILKGENVLLSYDSGGGELDLAEFVSDRKRGTFYLVMKTEFEGEAEFSAFYLSNAKTRKVGDDILGNGCKSIFKVTDFIEKKMKSSGIAVNTTDQRHVSALAGTYFFVYLKKDGRKAISYLDVQDSRYPQHMCR